MRVVMMKFLPLIGIAGFKHVDMVPGKCSSKEGWEK
ncbi:hypothetical protein BH18THE2_BH18THE2_20810 [soil metagenome]